MDNDYSMFKQQKKYCDVVAYDKQKRVSTSMRACLEAYAELNNVMHALFMILKKIQNPLKDEKKYLQIVDFVLHKGLVLPQYCIEKSKEIEDDLFLFLSKHPGRSTPNSAASNLYHCLKDKDQRLSRRAGRMLSEISHIKLAMKNSAGMGKVIVRLHEVTECFECPSQQL